MNPWAWLADVGPALADTATAAWALPSPLDVLAIAALWLLRCVLWAPVTATQNLASWGDWYPVGFWMLFGLLWSIGTVGLETDAKVFQSGEDVGVYGSRASWLGFAAKVTRTRVKLRAQTAATQIIVGRGNYWAGKVLALLDENEKLRAAAARTSEPVHIEFRGNIPDPEKLRELIAREFGTRPGDDG